MSGCLRTLLLLTAAIEKGEVLAAVLNPSGSSSGVGQEDEIPAAASHLHSISAKAVSTESACVGSAAERTCCVRTAASL
jgi:hypothetical protein